MSIHRATLLALGLGVATVMGVAAPAGAEEQPRGHGHAAAAPPSGAAAATEAQALTFDVASLNRSGITGTVALRPAGGDKVEVAVALQGAGAGPRPIHVHEGACAELNPTPKIPLATVVDGTSTTVVDASLRQLTATPHAIFVHKSPQELPVLVACADLTVLNRLAAVPATGEGDGDTGLAAGLLGLGGALAAVGALLRRRTRRAPAARAG
jgi:Cu/Zn superoxide dismutase